MKLDHYFFHVGKSSEYQKRSSPKIEEFLSPKSSEDQKKVFVKNWRNLVPEVKWWSKKVQKIIQHSDADHSQMIGGNADAEHTQIIGRDAAKLLGGTYPPRVSAPMANFHFSIILFTLKVQVVPIS